MATRGNLPAPNPMGPFPDARSFFAIFESIEDPRIERSRLHPLPSILVLCLCAVLSGCNSVVEIADYGEENLAFLSELASFPNGSPSHDTICRVLAKLNPCVLERLFIDWTTQMAQNTSGEVIAIDGKTLRGSVRSATDSQYFHAIHAFATSNKMILGHVGLDSKTGETTAISRLLELINIRGAIVTIDAAGCNDELAGKIIDGGADFVLCVKANQPRLLETIRTSFADHDTTPARATRGDSHDEDERSHGRLESRRISTLKVVEGHGFPEKWELVRTVIRVERDRVVGTQNSSSVHYYVSSAVLDAQQAGRVIRSHWAIENSLHWVLDVSFREDDSRVRCDHAAENYAVIRRIALNLLRSLPDKKISIQRRRNRCAWNHEFLLQRLTSGGPNLVR